FAGAVDAAAAGKQGLAISAGSGNVNFTDDVGSGAALAEFSISGTTGTTTLDGNVTTTGSQTYGEATTIAGAAVDLATTNSDVTFSNRIQGPPQVAGNNLTVDVGSGTIAFRQGTAYTLGSIETRGSGLVELGGGFYNSGVQDYQQDVMLLGTAVTLHADGDVVLGGSVSAQIADSQSLSLWSSNGNVHVNGDVGSTAALFSFTTIIASLQNSTYLGGSVTTTTGGQAYGNLVLTNSVTLTQRNPDRAIALAGIKAASAGVQSLTINAGGGDVLFASPAGATGLASLTINGSGTTRISGLLSTVGPQTYNEPVIESGGPVDLTAVNGAITFTGTVESSNPAPQPFVLSAGGDVRFAAAVGASQPLGDVVITCAGTVTISSSFAVHSLDASAMGKVTIDAPLSAASGNSISLKSPAIEMSTAQSFGDADVTLAAESLVLGGRLDGVGTLDLATYDDSANIDING